MTTDTLLTSHDLPERFHEADARAVAAQRRYLLVIKTQIAGLLVPAVSGTVAALMAGAQPALTMISVVSLVIVAATRLIQRFSAYESVWHTARAIAEAIRSLCWQFAAGGSLFDGMSDADADARLRQVINDISQEPSAHVGSQDDELVTAPMKALRHAPAAIRRDVYLTQRMVDQLSWYRDKADTASNRGRLWDWLFVGSATLAILFGIAQVSGVIEVSLVSLFGLTAAVIGTWTGVNQFGSLHAAYTNTASELEPLLDEMRSASPEAWPTLVTTAEAVLAQEHDLWLVKRR